MCVCVHIYIYIYNTHTIPALSGITQFLYILIQAIQRVRARLLLSVIQNKRAHQHQDDEQQHS